MNQVPVNILKKHHNKEIKEIHKSNKLEHWLKVTWIIATIITLITGALIINGTIPLKNFIIPAHNIPIYQLVPIAISIYDIIFTCITFIIPDICKHMYDNR